MKKNKQFGLTLVELMVVMSIMSILIGIFAPNVMIMVERAQNSDIVSTGKKFQQYLETYAIDAEANGTRNYPITSTEILATNLFNDSKIDNTFYINKDNPHSEIVAGTATAVTYNAAGDGQYIAFIPKQKLIYDVLIAPGYSTASNLVKGTLVYFPYTYTTHEYPAATEEVAGYEIRAFKSDGKLIRGFHIVGGETY